MNRRFPIVLALLAVALIIALISLELISRRSDIAPEPTDEVASTTRDTSLPKEVESESAQIKREALAVFNRYIEAAKNHDLVEIKRLSYQISETCRDNSKIKECNSLMDNAFYFGSQIDEKSLTNVYYDTKQIILSSNYVESVEQEFMSAVRSILYFVRDGDGIKLLSLNPTQGSIILRKEMSTSTATLELKKSVADSDQDSLPDKTELCEDATSAECVKTNPNKKDSDGDLWWDSIEILFYKK